ncbi:MAG: S49 family peptidase [Bacteroidales bacterium]|nr:S49 family peptidase [Bacteroidales bacterium]
MSYPYLLDAIVRGKWAINDNSAISNLEIASKLIRGEYSTEQYAGRKSKKDPFKVKLDSGKFVVASNPKGMDGAPSQSTAIIPLHGTMLKYGTWCGYGTEEIAYAIRQAADSSRMDSIVVDGHSGGGSVDSIPPIFDAIVYAKARKPVVACVDLCCSAALYGLLPCDEIMAANDLSCEVGSIGVMMNFMDYSAYYEQLGVKEHLIRSTLSEYKNLPLELARKGEYAKIQEEELDPLALKFQTDVKQYRGDKLDISVEGILNGRTFFAPDALKYGLIDSIGSMDKAIARAKELVDIRLMTSFY